MTPLPLTRAVLWAIATDHANRRMRRAGRLTWSLTDYRAAVRYYLEHEPECDDGGAP
jgi:hypothetical protein